MKIFLSHQHRDNSIVIDYARRLSESFGEDSVLLDDWSVKPGESIIDYMSDGLDQTTHFVLFWSRNAKESGAVKTEWQVALMRAFCRKLTIVVLRLDDEPIPPILENLKYLRHSDGFEECLAGLELFVDGGKESETATVALDVYHEIIFCRDDSLLIKLFSDSDQSEIGPFMFCSDTHHSYFEFSSENERKFNTIISDDATFDGRKRFGIGFQFLDGGVSRGSHAIMRLKKLRQCSPGISLLSVQRYRVWQDLPLTTVTDETNQKLCG